MTLHPDAFIIDKVKYDGIKVRIEYQRRRQDDRYDEAAIASFDRPLPAFVEVLGALWLDVCNICEFSHKYRDGLVVRGVSFSHTDGVMGAVITALKSVKAASAPVVINTPHIPSAPYGDGAGGPVLPAETIDRLNDVRDEAIRYISGERAQQQLDLKPPPPADPTPSKSPSKRPSSER